MNSAKTYFDSVASGYAEKSEGGIWRWLRRREASVIASMIGSGPLGDALELGSGSGYYTRRLSDLGCRSLVAVDFSPKMVESIRIPGCVKKKADIQNFVSEDRFDLILCAGALEFLEHPEVIFGNASKMLRTKGSLIVLLPLQSLLGRFYRLFHRSHHVPVRLFRLQEVDQWAKAAGLIPVRRQKAALFSLALKFSKSEDHE
ncbi:MAG: class I SAM-dependent methyltransferase [Deltaproteobacteria bacterium]|nr:class I SAM-dependent methyltransferase [Deltaproteobacteria bacterium]